MSFRDDAFLGLFRTKTHTKKSLSLSPLHLLCVLSIVFWHERTPDRGGRSPPKVGDEYHCCWWSLLLPLVVVVVLFPITNRPGISRLEIKTQKRNDPLKKHQKSAFVHAPQKPSNNNGFGVVGSVLSETERGQHHHHQQHHHVR